MKTDVTKYCIRAAILCLFGVFIFELSQATSRLALIPNRERMWIHDSIAFSYPESFDSIGFYGWIYGPRYTRRSKHLPWKQDSNAIFVTTILQSGDKQCELYHAVIPDNVGYYAKDSQGYARASFYYPQNLVHRDFMTRYIPEFRGQDDFKFDDYVTVVGGKMPREFFNADSVFFWNFPIKPTKQDGETYTECIFMYLWSREQWVGLTFAWFFTEQGKKQKWQYIEKLKKCVWYKDMTTN